MTEIRSSKINKQKHNQEITNPCLKEQTLTYKCFDKNSYDKKKCEDQMNNYKLCKSFWGHICTLRKKNGTRPYIPTDIDEREKIKSEFFNEFRKKQQNQIQH